MARKISPIVISKSVNPIIDLLEQLRANPTEEGIKQIVDYVREERGDYYHLRKAVENAVARPLTEPEQLLTRQLQ